MYWWEEYVWSYFLLIILRLYMFAGFFLFKCIFSVFSLFTAFSNIYKVSMIVPEITFISCLSSVFLCRVTISFNLWKIIISFCPFLLFSVILLYSKILPMIYSFLVFNCVQSNTLLLLLIDLSGLCYVLAYSCNTWGNL